jgi:hypothetical protein
VVLFAKAANTADTPCVAIACRGSFGRGIGEGWWTSPCTCKEEFEMVENRPTGDTEGINNYQHGRSVINQVRSDRTRPPD